MDGVEVSEIKLRHDSPRTLAAYRGWVRQLQGFTKSAQLIGAFDNLPQGQDWKGLAVGGKAAAGVGGQFTVGFGFAAAQLLWIKAFYGTSEKEIKNSNIDRNICKCIGGHNKKTHEIELEPLKNSCMRRQTPITK